MESRVKSMQIERGISRPLGAQETVGGEPVFDGAFVVDRAVGIADVRIAGLHVFRRRVLGRRVFGRVRSAGKSKRGLSLNLPTQQQ